MAEPAHLDAGCVYSDLHVELLEEVSEQVDASGERVAEYGEYKDVVLFVSVQPGDHRHNNPHDKIYVYDPLRKIQEVPKYPDLGPTVPTRQHHRPVRH